MAEGAQLVEQALLSFLRGGTFPALARHVAWQAVREVGASGGCLDWLTALVLQPLARGVEGLEFAVERAGAAARAEHLRRWPYDEPGAALAARGAGEEEARRELERLQTDVAAWAVEILRGRLRAQAA